MASGGGIEHVTIGSAVAASFPPTELLRLAELERLAVLDTVPEQMFDDVAELAACICGTPIALVSLVDSERQWFKARVGLEARETPRALAFCAHAILRPSEVMVVPDAARDQRFAGNLLVVGDPRIRFYAGAPIVLSSGLAMGTVCAIDRVPRVPTDEQLAALARLARQVAHLLEYRQQTEAQRMWMQRTLDRQRVRLLQLSAASMASIDQQAVASLDGRFAYVNDAFLSFWGLERDQVEGALPAEVLPLAAAERMCAQMARALAGVPGHDEGYLAAAGGEPHYVRVVCVPIRDERGELIGTITRVTDLRELKQSEDNLQQALDRLSARNVAQSRFIRMISHDVREPVNTICNFSQLLQRRYAGALGADGERYLAFVNEGGTRIRVLLEDLLTLVRLDGSPLRRVETGLHELVRAAAADLTAAIEKAGAEVSIGELPSALIDATLVRVLVQNLISNAIKFTRPGGPPRISVYGQRDDEGWRLSVRDNGIGIAPEHLSALFVEFKRLHSQRDYEGTGLGLAICQRIAELHGGRMEVESTLGDGSVFSLVVPAAE